MVAPDLVIVTSAIGVLSIFTPCEINVIVWPVKSIKFTVWPTPILNNSALPVRVVFATPVMLEVEIASVSPALTILNSSCSLQLLYPYGIVSGVSTTATLYCACSFAPAESPAGVYMFFNIFLCLYKL